MRNWTKEEVKKKINEEFKGKAVVDRDKCRYFIDDGRKCAIGLFLKTPEEYIDFVASVSGLLNDYPELKPEMPHRNIDILSVFQDAHDSLEKNLSVKEQKEILCKWVDENWI